MPRARRTLARVGDVISWTVLGEIRRGTVKKISTDYCIVRLEEPRPMYDYERMLGHHPDLMEDEIHRHNGRYTIEVYAS